jgi:hypothetical protein
MDLLDGDVVAIDGSRFKAVNSKAKNYTRGKLRQKWGEIDKAIERYLGESDCADEVFEQTGTVLPEARMERSLRKLNHLQKEALRYRSIEQRMDETEETQVALSDPDAKSMATTARMPRIVGFNVQTAVEADNHLIVAHEGTMLGFDRMTLSAAPSHRCNQRLSAMDGEMRTSSIACKNAWTKIQLAVRSMTVEHPHSTIKSWMGATHFKMRTLKKWRRRWRCTCWPTT